MVGIGQASPRDAKAIFEAIDTKAIFEAIDTKAIFEAIDTKASAMVIIGSQLSVSERQSLIDGFANDLKEMRDGGGSIIAIAVASE